jgi:Undecaprenyl-phosphate glucose phosphotransferase
MRIVPMLSRVMGIGSGLAEIFAGIFNRQISSAPDFNEPNRRLLTFTQIVVDNLIMIASSGISLSFVIYLSHASAGVEYLTYLGATIGTTSIMAIGFKFGATYQKVYEANRVLAVKSTMKCLTLVILFLISCLFILKISDDVSRLWLAIWSMMSAVALCGFRLLTASAVQRLRRSGRLLRNVAIVGASEIGQRLAVKLIEERSGIRLIGVFDERQSRFFEGGGSTTVRRLTALYKLLRIGCVDEVVIALPPHASHRILELSRRFHRFAVSLWVLAPDGYDKFRVLDSRQYDNVGTFRVMDKPLDEVDSLVKRIEDVVFALSCLLLTAPLMLVIALSIKLDSCGPVLFKQKRLGANNVPFNLLKFRSMYVEHADPLGSVLTRAGDPRITRVGRFLRMMSLDELPQLINVLRGDMSLVGPRPHALAASAAGVSYARAISEYPIRHRVKPGITGWAQVNGWRGETTTIEQIRRRIEHDLYYIENWSLTFDLLILARTVFSVLSRANAI